MIILALCVFLGIMVVVAILDAVYSSPKQRSHQHIEPNGGAVYIDVGPDHQCDCGGGFTFVDGGDGDGGGGGDWCWLARRSPCGRSHKPLRILSSLASLPQIGGVQQQQILTIKSCGLVQVNASGAWGFMQSLCGCTIHFLAKDHGGHGSDIPRNGEHDATRQSAAADAIGSFMSLRIVKHKFTYTLSKPRSSSASPLLLDAIDAASVFRDILIDRLDSPSLLVNETLASI